MKLAYNRCIYACVNLRVCIKYTRTKTHQNSNSGYLCVARVWVICTDLFIFF